MENGEQGGAPRGTSGGRPSSLSPTTSCERVLHSCCTCCHPQSSPRHRCSARRCRLVVLVARHPHHPTVLSSRPSTCGDRGDPSPCSELPGITYRPSAPPLQARRRSSPPPRPVPPEYRPGQLAQAQHAPQQQGKYALALGTDRLRRPQPRRPTCASPSTFDPLAPSVVEADCLSRQLSRITWDIKCKTLDSCTAAGHPSCALSPPLTPPSGSPPPFCRPRQRRTVSSRPDLAKKCLQHLLRTPTPSFRRSSTSGSAGERRRDAPDLDSPSPSSSLNGSVRRCSRTFFDESLSCCIRCGAMDELSHGSRCRTNADEVKKVRQQRSLSEPSTSQ